MKTDLIFKKARIYNTFIKKWHTADVAVLKEKILFVGNTDDEGLSARTIVDCEERPLIPGLIDIHLHIESSLCSPTVFSQAVIQRGVTTVVSEPHEIANVFGIAGVEEMIRVSQGTALDIFYGIPSSVPSTSAELESSGGSIGLAETEELIRKYPEVICLGEVMNYAALIAGFGRIVEGKTALKSQELIDRVQQRQPLWAIEGHCPSVKGLDMAKLLYLGISSDHCLQDLEGMKQRLAGGMFVELQEKSIQPEIIDYLREQNREGLYSFITDDVPPDVMAEKGHLDYIVKKALGMGLPLEKAIIAGSTAPAARMGFQDRGSISPGKLADLILLDDDSARFAIRSVYKRGVQQFRETSPSPCFSTRFTNSLKLPSGHFSSDMFSVPAESAKQEARCRVMIKNADNTYTAEEICGFPVKNNKVKWRGADVNLVTVLERYSGKGNYAQGLLGGERLTGGAFCSSYAHDHHNILTIGDNPEDMRIALEWVIREGGGICVVSGSRILASLPLPVGGILSEAPMQELSVKTAAIQQALRTLGMKHANPLMSLSTLTLPVSPALKITDKGLVDVMGSRVVGLFAVDPFIQRAFHKFQ